jgi:hypothetical protein
MASYFERYISGEHEAAWRELVAQKDAIRNEPILFDAMNVCKEICRRGHRNLVMIYQRLCDLGFEFAEPSVALVETKTNAKHEVDEFERVFGVMPLVARVWYERIDSVDYRQTESQLLCKQAIAPTGLSDVYGLGSHPVLLFQSLEKCRRQAAEIAQKRNNSSARSGAKSNTSMTNGGTSSFLHLGGWASNGDQKGFELPNMGIDGKIYNDGGGDIYFVDELRSAFRWGGFPFWRRLFENPKYYSPYEYRPGFARLLPMLKEGLLPL